MSETAGLNSVEVPAVVDRVEARNDLEKSDEIVKSVNSDKHSQYTAMLVVQAITTNMMEPMCPFKSTA